MELSTDKKLGIIKSEYSIPIDDAFLEILSEGQREKAEEMKECLEDFASAQEKRAYTQGYADCIQVLFHMGFLKENEGLKWAEKMELQ